MVTFGKLKLNCLYCELVAYYAYWHDDRKLLMSNIDDVGDDDDDDDYNGGD